MAKGNFIHEFLQKKFLFLLKDILNICFTDELPTEQFLFLL